MPSGRSSRVAHGVGAPASSSRELDAGAPTPWATLDDLPEGIHPWFRAEIERAGALLATERELVTLKATGWSDAEIGEAWGTGELEVREARRAAGIRPA